MKVSNHKTVLKQVGKKLKFMREKAGLTQNDVAKIFKYTTAQFVSNWERGKIMPPLATLLHLAQVYRITWGEIRGFLVAEIDAKIKDAPSSALKKFNKNTGAK